jgi:WhiB family redox-sensing transcriptional regulator
MRSTRPADRPPDPTPDDWRAEALCAQTDPEVFFPERGGSPAAAKAVCRVCPVRVPCLAFALAAGEVFGVWGGLTGRERRRLLHLGSRAERDRVLPAGGTVEVDVPGVVLAVAS